MLKIILGVLIGFSIGFGATFVSLSSSALSFDKTTTKNQEVNIVEATSTPTPTISSLIKIPDSPSNTATKSGELFGIGQFCGGKENTPCPSGLICKKEDSGRESPGSCVKK